MARRVVILMLDGLRRDFVTPALMPNLCTLRDRGLWCARHRSVFPSVTRVVSASFATGCLPSRHGLAGNTIAMTEGGVRRLFDAGRPEFIDERRRLTGGVLAVPTLADRLGNHGGAVVYSNVSPGAAYMHDPQGAGCVYHRAGSLGPGRVPMDGDEALAVTPDLDGDAALVTRFIDRCILPKKGAAPTLALAWLGHPDTTQHGTPLGSPAHLDALRRADDHVRQVVAAVDEARNSGDEILLLGGSDHGHQTVHEVIDIDAELMGAGLKAASDSDDLIVAPNGTAALVYTDDPQRAEQVAAFLSAQPWAGQVIGADSFADHGIAAGGGLALALSMAADDEAVNEHGVPGLSFASRPAAGKPDRLGCGQHGGLGRWEQSPVMIAQGADFIGGSATGCTTTAADIAPTVLCFLGLPTGGMDGRALQTLSTPPEPTDRT